MRVTNHKMDHILLTPGPLSTSDSVRAAMNRDSCTWDIDYKAIVSEIRNQLLEISGCDPAIYTTVMMQGSGTFGVESVLGSSIDDKKHQLLFLTNGVYGKRMIKIAAVLQLPYVVYEVNENQAFNQQEIENILQENDKITHVAMVHCETTTGILNNLCEVAALIKKYKKYFIVDAMSSFGGVQFNVSDLAINFLISSANKCIQGVPGFSFIVCKKEDLVKCKNQARSLSLDLYDQWQEMEKDPGKWRFTSPTHVVLAFKQALNEFLVEGAYQRSLRFAQNQKRLVEGMSILGFKPFIDSHLQSPIITTFLQPTMIPQTAVPFHFADFYSFLKAKGFIIYPGKVTQENTFRIGSIGHLFLQDIERFLDQVALFINLHRS